MDEANALTKKKKYKEAETCLKEALSAAEEFGPQDLRVATTLNNLGLLYYNQKRYEEAEPVYNRAIQIRENGLGHEHPQVAISLSNLALLYYAQKKHTKALSLAQDALKIREKTLAPDHLDLAMSLNNLALIHHALKQHDKAERYSQRALEIREQHFGSDDHPLVAASLQNLLKIAKAQKDTTKAEELEKRLAATKEKSGTKAARQNTAVTPKKQPLPEPEPKVADVVAPREPVASAEDHMEAVKTAPNLQRRRKLGFFAEAPAGRVHRSYRATKRSFGWHRERLSPTAR